MTLGGGADGGSGFARQTWSDTIGVMTYLSRGQLGCEARFPVAVRMSCPGF
jgi:hypothetical protein